jgi:hypothetical protein
MSTVGSLDAIATKVGSIAGIKRCYGVGASSDVRPIPQGIDDPPVAVVIFDGAEQASGHAEALVLSVTVDIWARATNAGYANKTLLTFIDLARTAFRADMDLGGECTRCSMVGADALQPEDVNGQQYLVLPIRLEVLIERFASDATA